MGRSVARWPTPHLKESTLRNLYKCSSYDCLRSNSVLDVIVVSIYFRWPITAVPSRAKSNTFPYTSILVRPHQQRSIVPDGVACRPLLVEAPGTAPGSAICTQCTVYRHSYRCSTPDISNVRGKLKANRAVSSHLFPGEQVAFAPLRYKSRMSGRTTGCIWTF